MAFACQKPETPETGEISIEPSTLEFSADGEEKSVSLTSNVAWQIRGYAAVSSWLEISPANGGASAGTQTISVRRACASVVLESVTNAMSAAVYRQPGSFRIKDVYLMNVPGKVTFGGTLKASALADADWYARMAAETDGTKSALILDKQDAVTVEYGKKYETKHVFYSYPNECSPSKEGTWSPRATLLVIDAEFLVDGTWHSCYYPVTLFDEAEGTGLQSNRQYKVRLTINRPGSDDPNHPVEFDTVSGVIDVADWETGTEYTETI